MLHLNTEIGGKDIAFRNGEHLAIENSNVGFPSSADLQNMSSKSSSIFILDVDEGVIGFVTFCVALRKVFANNFSLEEVKQDFIDDAAKLSSDPLKWLHDQASHDGGLSDTVVGFVLPGLVLPFSALAIKAGIEEIREAWHTHLDLTEKRGRIEESLQRLQRSNSSDDSHKLDFSDDLQKLDSSDDLQKLDSSDDVFLLHAKRIETQSLAIIDTALQHNFYAGGIGCGALVSGGTLFTKAVVDITLLAVTLSVPQTVALTIATTVVGGLGTIVFGPVAAVAALTLGGIFVHQARMVGKDLAEDRIKIDECNEADPYEKFIAQELTWRENFAARFMRWNAGFLGGSCLGVLTAATKAAFGIAALAGFSALLSNPVSFAVLLVLGIIGGVSMFACCWQFVMLSGKAKRHESYRTGETSFLGRRFDALQTVHSSMHPDENAARAERAFVFNFVSSRDSARQEFLQARAVDMDRFRAWELGDSDDRPAVAQVSKKRQRYKDVQASMAAVGTYLGNLFGNLLSRAGNLYNNAHKAAIDRATEIQGVQAELAIFGVAKWIEGNLFVVNTYFVNLLSNIFTSAHKPALYKAKAVYAPLADELTAYGLARWWESDDELKKKADREQDQRNLLITMLTQQKNFLTAKLDTYKKIESYFFASKELPPETKLTFEQACKEAESDEPRLNEIKILLTNLSTDEPLNPLKREFLRLQGLDTSELRDDENATRELNDLFAEYLVTDLTEELETTRGILFDLERRSSDLQDKYRRNQRLNLDGS
ncbi:MAG: hypothetical protein K0R08_2309 [Solimicrobium sp.]|jgi:hypothetical protein|nr:hypothetical protein [Solimicrobium sp.]